MGPKQVLPLQARMNKRVIVTKMGYYCTSKNFKTSALSPNAF